MELGRIGSASSSHKSDHWNNENTSNELNISNEMNHDTENLTTEFCEMNHNRNGRNETIATASTPLATTTDTANPPPPKRISEFDAIQHLIKGNLGPGCLNIPHAFALTGWVLGLFLFVMVAVQGIYSMILLVYCKQWIRQDQKQRQRQGNENATNATEDKEIVTFMDVAYASHGRAGSICVEVLLFILQAGVCCVFLSLISTNLHAAFPKLESELCVFIVTLLLLVVVLVKDLKELKWLSLGANCLMFTAVGTAAVSAMWVLFVNKSDNDNAENDEPAKAKLWTNNPAAIATFISSMFYSFEGIGLVMPVENSFVGYNHNSNAAPIRNSSACDLGEENDQEELERASRTKTFVNPVLVGAMGTVAFLFLLIGATCGPAFPDIVDGSVTAYLTTKYPDSLWYQAVNVSVMVAVFLTFPLQLTPAMEVLGEWFAPGCDPVCCSSSSLGLFGCCGGGGGLLRRRAGPRRAGRHAVVAQSDDTERRPEGFDDEPEAAVTAIAPGPPSRNSCFGPYEWIFRRFLVVFGCAVVVLTVNDLGLLMSLFGALGNTGLAAMPCIIHWRLMQKGIAPLNFLLMAIDVSTIAVCMGVAVIGVAFSVREIMER